MSWVIHKVCFSLIFIPAVTVIAQRKYFLQIVFFFPTQVFYVKNWDSVKKCGWKHRTERIHVFTKMVKCSSNVHNSEITDKLPWSQRMAGHALQQLALGSGSEGSRKNSKLKTELSSCKVLFNSEPTWSIFTDRCLFYSRTRCDITCK